LLLPSPSSTPAPRLCYYRISGGSQEAAEVLCKATNIGTIELPIYGVWLNFDVDQSLINHCKFPLPGISDRDFELTPGQSDADCKKKPTGNPNQGHN